MTRREPRSDNKLIEEMQEEGSSAHQGRSGGLGANIGTRAELQHALGGEDRVTRVGGKDKGAQDEMKGKKTQAAIRSEESKHPDGG